MTNQPTNTTRKPLLFALCLVSAAMLSACDKPGGYSGESRSAGNCHCCGSKLRARYPFRRNAEHQILAMEKGRRGERYLAAGRHMEMREIMATLAQVSGVPMPTRKIPNALLWTIAYLNEFYHFLTKKPILLSRASVKGIEDEYDCTRFSHEKSARELGAGFRPFAETLKDTIAWYRENGWIK